MTGKSVRLGYFEDRRGLLPYWKIECGRISDPQALGKTEALLRFCSVESLARTKQKDRKNQRVGDSMGTYECGSGTRCRGKANKSGDVGCLRREKKRRASEELE